MRDTQDVCVTTPDTTTGHIMRKHHAPIIIAATVIALAVPVVWNVIDDPNTSPTFESDMASCSHMATDKATSRCYTETMERWHGNGGDATNLSPSLSLSPSYESLPGEIESLPPCTEEDGSSPDQPLPCRWDGGNNPSLSLHYIINPDFSVASLP